VRKTRPRVSASTLDNMRLVKREVVMGSRPLGITMFRIYDPAYAKEKDVTVERFENLDNHTELIVYEGYYDMTRGEPANTRIEKG